MPHGPKEASDRTLIDEEEESSFELIDHLNNVQISDDAKGNAIPNCPFETKLSAATGSPKNFDVQWKVHALWMAVLVAAVATTAALTHCPVHRIASPENISTAPLVTANTRDHEESTSAGWTEHEFWIEPDMYTGKPSLGFSQWEGLITHVDGYSNAKLTGLRLGDEIYKVNGVDAQELGTLGIQHLYKNAEGVSLVVRRYPDAQKNTLRRMQNVRDHYYRSFLEELNKKENAEYQLDMYILAFHVAAVFVTFGFYVCFCCISHKDKLLIESEKKVEELLKENNAITEKKRGTGGDKNDVGKSQGIHQTQREYGEATSSVQKSLHIKCAACSAQFVAEESKAAATGAPARAAAETQTIEPGEEVSTFFKRFIIGAFFLAYAYGCYEFAQIISGISVSHI